jgi:hypothetical protein
MTLIGTLITLAFFFLIYNDIRETSGSEKDIQLIKKQRENEKERAKRYGKTMDDFADEESKKE